MPAHRSGVGSVLRTVDPNRGSGRTRGGAGGGTARPGTDPPAAQRLSLRAPSTVGSAPRRALRALRDRSARRAVTSPQSDDRGRYSIKASAHVVPRYPLLDMAAYFTTQPSPQAWPRRVLRQERPDHAAGVPWCAQSKRRVVLDVIASAAPSVLEAAVRGRVMEDFTTINCTP